MRVFLVAQALTPTNAGLLAAFRRAGVESKFVQPAAARRRVRAGDVVLARLDVAPSLDRVDDGLRDLDRLEARGAHVLNPSGALLAAHDKLVTAERLAAAGVPHPPTWHIADGPDGVLAPPVVVKPRFGSWGRDVVLCEDDQALAKHVRGLQAVARGSGSRARSRRLRSRLPATTSA